MEEQGITLTAKLRRHNNFYTTKNLVIEKLKTIPELELLQREPEIVLLICRLIENNIPRFNRKSNYPIDKASLAIEIYESLFGELDIDGKANMLLQIDLLHSCDKIKRGNLLTIFYHYAKFFFVKKLS